LINALLKRAGFKLVLGASSAHAVGDFVGAMALGLI
jgi:hypothetical protein